MLCLSAAAFCPATVRRCRLRASPPLSPAPSPAIALVAATSRRWGCRRLCRLPPRPPTARPSAAAASLESPRGYAAVAAALCLSGCVSACLCVCLSACLSVSVCCMSIGRPVRLVPLVLSCCSSRLATWSASVGCSLVTTRTGDAERGRLHPPTRAGLCRSATRGREGGPGGGCVGGLRHPAYTLARTPLGRLLIAVGRAAPLSVAWLPLAGFLLPSSPLPQVAEAVGAGEVIGGSWSSILFSLDVAVGLWPLLREGLRSSRLRPGALTRPCAS